MMYLKKTGKATKKASAIKYSILFSGVATALRQVEMQGVGLGGGRISTIEVAGG